MISGRNVAFMGNLYPGYAVEVLDGIVGFKEPYIGCLHEDKDVLPHRIAITFNTLHTISKVRLTPTPGIFFFICNAFPCSFLYIVFITFFTIINVPARSC